MQKIAVSTARAGNVIGGGDFAPDGLYRIVSVQQLKNNQLSYEILIPSGRTQEEPKEANFLKLDSSRIRVRLGWKPHWSLLQAIEQTIAWAKEYLAGGKNILAELDRQIQEYFN